MTLNKPVDMTIIEDVFQDLFYRIVLENGPEVAALDWAILEKVHDEMDKRNKENKK